jgi:RNA polymerase sigma-70 factor (ECF subfamily)
MEAPQAHTLQVQKLFVKHQRQLRAFVLALWPDSTVADDILQEVFLTVTQKAEQFRLGTDFASWTRAIARFKAIEMRRASGKFLVSEDVYEILAAECPTYWADDRRLTALSRCMKTLAPKARELIQLRYVDELTPTEIAMRLSRTVNSIGVALTKARVLLRDCVEKQITSGEAS